jgi:hypothetical protein
MWMKPPKISTLEGQIQIVWWLVPIDFELDPNTISIHVSSEDELDHVSKNYL